MKPDLSACMSLEFIAANRTVSSQTDVYNCLLPCFYIKHPVDIAS